MRSLAVGVVCLVLVATAGAQFPIGHGTPVGGFTPSLFCEPIWFGNTSFGFRITGGPPFANAFLAVSWQHQDQIIGGLQVYVDVPAIFATYGTALDATGRAFIPVPLPGPETPDLAGLLAYAQAAVDDPSSPGSLGTTQGLLLEVTLHPVLAIGQTSSLELVDALTSAITPVAIAPSSVGAFTWGKGGRDLFVVTNGGISVIDTVLGPSTAVPLVSGISGALAWDRVHRRLYVQSSAAAMLTVIDGDRASPSFGAIVTQTSLANFTSIAVSADGSVIALLTPSATVERLIGDPASPAYLTSVPMPQPQVNLVGLFNTVGGVHVSPDGRVISFPIYTLGGYDVDVVHRFDVATNQWIDHNPVAAGTQPLQVSTLMTGIPLLFRIMPSRDGSSLVLSATTSGAATVRVDLDLADPTHLSVVPLPVIAGAGRDYTALTPSGRFVVRRDFNFFNPVGSAPLSLVELATGAVTPWVTITVASTSAPRMAWR